AMQVLPTSGGSCTSAPSTRPPWLPTRQPPPWPQPPLGCCWATRYSRPFLTAGLSGLGVTGLAAAAAALSMSGLAASGLGGAGRAGRSGGPGGPGLPPIHSGGSARVGSWRDSVSEGTRPPSPRGERTRTSAQYNEPRQAGAVTSL